MLFISSRVWDKEKILSPHEESNLRPSDLHSNTLPLSHRDSTVSKVYYLIYIYYFFKFYFIIYYSTACNQPTLTVFLAFNIQLNIIEWLFSEIRINILTRVS